MEAPEYKPETWIRYTRSQGQAVGKIVGAVNSDGSQWTYYVINAANPGQTYTVRADTIIEEISLD